MRKSMHTIWLTGLTLMALLLSSVSASASLNMSMNNNVDSHTAQSVSHGKHFKCSLSQFDSTDTETDCHNATNSAGSPHQCTNLNCTPGDTLVSQLFVTHHQAVQFIPFSRDTIGYTNSDTRTLHRPPIA